MRKKIYYALFFLMLLLSGASFLYFPKSNEKSSITVANHDHATEVEIKPSETSQIVSQKVIGYGDDETSGNDKLTHLSELNTPWLFIYLVRAIHDNRHTLRWRSYCTQHLASYHIKHRDVESMQEIVGLADHDEREIAEVALFSLGRIVSECGIPQAQQEYISITRILKQNIKNTRHPNIRIASIRAFSLMKYRDISENITEIAGNPNEELSVRISAIDAIGTFRIESFEGKLQELAFSKIKLISESSKNALRRLHPLNSILPPEKHSVATLREALKNSHAQVRNEAVLALFKFGSAAAVTSPELASSILMLDGNSLEGDVFLHLDLIRSFGLNGRGAVGALNKALEERCILYSGREEKITQRIRASVLVTLADIGEARSALPCIADFLANSDEEMQLNYAAAAHAVNSLNTEEGTPFVPFLLKALRPEFWDRKLILKANGPETSARIESIRALAKIGSPASAALPLLENLALSDTRSDKQLPPWNIEAKIALARIRGSTQ